MDGREQARGRDARSAAERSPYARPEANGADSWSTPESVYAAEPSNPYRRGAPSNPYARPSERAEDEAQEQAAFFAPPTRLDVINPLPLFEDEPEDALAPVHVYQTRGLAQDDDGGEEDAFEPRRPTYLVEDEDAQRKHRRKRRLVIALFVVGALCVLAGGAYLERDWLKAQWKRMSAQEEAVAVGGDANPTLPPVSGYDKAPALVASDRAKRGISAVTGGLALDTYAVTADVIVARASVGAGRYDYYLFNARDGLLLACYENLGESELLVQGNDRFYVPVQPYLLGARGGALLNLSRYEHLIGKNASLRPMSHGWAVLHTEKGDTYNYVNEENALFSTLWFKRAFSFRSDWTLAYVDTGNVTSAQERYALYILSADGGMRLWRHTADMSGVLGVVGKYAIFDTGEVIALDAPDAEPMRASEVCAYLDCNAMAVRDADTGKVGFFINDEQLYDFAYDSIEPVRCEIEWAESEAGALRCYAVTNASYPQPLSHYFALRKGDSEELVAVSTTSVCPVALE